MSNGGVLDVVLEGQLLTQQLENNLNECCSVEYCRTMVHGILAAWEKLMFMANTIPDPWMDLSLPLAKLESPEVSDGMTLQQPLVCQERQQQRQPKKRKSDLPTWTSQFRARSPTAGADDGFNWRKYGQKEILGYKEPRCYYRCTHRHTQKCLATKHIQRSEHDPSVYEVKYHGKHTCIQKGKRKSTCGAAETVQQANPHFNIEILQSLKMSLSVETEGLPGSDQEPPSTSASASCPTPSFSTPSPMEEDGFAFSGSFSSFSSFMSPTGAAADELGNSFWAEPFLEGNELQGTEMAPPSTFPSTTISPTAGVEFVGDAWLEVVPDFFGIFE